MVGSVDGPKTTVALRRQVRAVYWKARREACIDDCLHGSKAGLRLQACGLGDFTMGALAARLGVSKRTVHNIVYAGREDGEKPGAKREAFVAYWHQEIRKLGLDPLNLPYNVYGYTLHNMLQDEGWPTLRDLAERGTFGVRYSTLAEWARKSTRRQQLPAGAKRRKWQ